MFASGAASARADEVSILFPRPSLDAALLTGLGAGAMATFPRPFAAGQGWGIQYCAPGYVSMTCEISVIDIGHSKRCLESCLMLLLVCFRGLRLE